MPDGVVSGGLDVEAVIEDEKTKEKIHIKNKKNQQRLLVQLIHFHAWKMFELKIWNLIVLYLIFIRNKITIDHMILLDTIAEKKKPANINKIIYCNT